MIGLLSGQLAEKEPGRVIVYVGGVGYAVQVPLSTFYGLGEIGSPVSLRVHTHVREDALALFGFTTVLELDVFEHLISISGVGPRLALAVLSGIETPDLVRAVRGGDVGRLTKIPGVGKKTAERIGLELRDRMPAELASDQDEGDTGSAATRDDVMSALLNLGYHRPLPARAVDRVLQTTAGTEEFETILRLVLRELAK